MRTDQPPLIPAIAPPDEAQGLSLKLRRLLGIAGIVIGLMTGAEELLGFIATNYGTTVNVATPAFRPIAQCAIGLMAIGPLLLLAGSIGLLAGKRWCRHLLIGYSATWLLAMLLNVWLQAGYISHPRTWGFGVSAATMEIRWLLLVLGNTFASVILAVFILLSFRWPNVIPGARWDSARTIGVDSASSSAVPLAVRLVWVLSNLGIALAGVFLLSWIIAEWLAGNPLLPTSSAPRDFYSALPEISTVLGIGTPLLLLTGAVATRLGRQWGRVVLLISAWCWFTGIIVYRAFLVTSSPHMIHLPWKDLLLSLFGVTVTCVYPAFLLICPRWPEIKLRADDQLGGFAPVIPVAMATRADITRRPASVE